MSVVIKTIKDYFNNYVYPKTKTKAVYDDSNNRLDNTLASVAHFDNDSSTGTISDPVLKQSDIATTLGTSDTKTASQNLVNTVNTNLGNPSSASAVTGADAFSKISSLNSDIVAMKGKHNVVFYATCPPSTNYGACRITFGGNFTGVTITLKSVYYRDGTDPNVVDITSSSFIAADSSFPRALGFCLQITNPPCLGKYLLITVDFD